jgi:hypothetical protein
MSAAPRQANKPLRSSMARYFAVAHIAYACVYRKPHPVTISALADTNSLFPRRNSLIRKNNSLFC